MREKDSISAPHELFHVFKVVYKSLLNHKTIEVVLFPTFFPVHMFVLYMEILFINSLLVNGSLYLFSSALMI